MNAVPPAGPLNGQLSWSGRAPLHWRALDHWPNDHELAGIDDRNLALLNALALIEDSPARQPDEPSPLAVQLERLEAKFDLVLAMLSEALLPAEVTPGLVELRVGGGGMTFAAEAAPEPGTVVEVSVHFSARLPRPVVLFGIVLATAGDGERTVTIEFQRQGPETREALERLVFRRHRRSIAQQRPAPAPRRG